LAISRAIGDWFLYPAVISDPFVNKVVLKAEDEFLILACDGVWDVLTDEEAVAFVLKTYVNLMDVYENENEAVQKTAEKLRTHAFKKGSMDNISVVLLHLKKMK